MVDASALTIESVWFKRSKDSPEERGIMLGDDRILIDMLCKKVTHVWSWGQDYEIRVVYRPPVQTFHVKKTKKHYGDIGPEADEEAHR